MKEWFIYQGEGNPAGPFTTELLARGIIAGKVARDAFVACQGDPQWLSVMAVPEVAGAVQAMESAGTLVPPRPINTVPPAPAPQADSKPQEMRPLFEMAQTPPASTRPSAPAAPLAAPTYLTRAASQPPAPPAPAPSQPHPLPPVVAPASSAVPLPSPMAPPAPASSAVPLPSPMAPPAPVAPVAAPAPVSVAPPAAVTKPAEAKKEEPKPPVLSPKYRLIPIGIFGLCFVLSAIVFGASRFVGQTEVVPAGQASGQAK